ncbi:GIY-YIG nuclease family protein [Flavobacterium sp. RSSA_27]
MEEFVVYILYSKKFNKNYIGFTSNLIERFKSHNVLGTKGYTIKFSLGK